MKIDGSIDCIQDGVVAGWVIDTNSPNNPVIVQILIDDEVIAQGCANQFRQDLKDAGIGDGNHGFHIPLPNSIKEGYITISAAALGSTEKLRNSPLSGNFRPLAFAPASFVDQFEQSSLPWLDRENWEVVLADKLKAGIFSFEDEQNFRFWRENGYIIFKKAVPLELIDKAWRDYERAWLERPTLMTNTPGIGVKPLSELPERSNMPNTFRFLS